MKNQIEKADICELAYELTRRKLGKKAEKIIKKEPILTVTYTKTGEKTFNDYYDLITNILKV